MMTAIAYEIFFFLEGIYFWRYFNFECLILEIYSKYNPYNLLVFYTLVFQFYEKVNEKMIEK